MPRKRFTRLQRYIHLNDNAIMKERGHPDHDVLPLLSQVQETINDRYNPGQNLAIDEAMVAYKGRSFIKQYLPNKPTKWGFKVWSLADSSNGYICGIDIYCGRHAHPSTNGLGYDVVANLMENHLDKHHHCYFDNFFTSVKLLDDLLAANLCMWYCMRQPSWIASSNQEARAHEERREHQDAEGCHGGSGVA